MKERVSVCVCVCVRKRVTERECEHLRVRVSKDKLNRATELAEQRTGGGGCD